MPELSGGLPQMPELSLHAHSTQALNFSWQGALETPMLSNAGGRQPEPRVGGAQRGAQPRGAPRAQQDGPGASAGPA